MYRPKLLLPVFLAAVGLFLVLGTFHASRSESIGGRFGMAPVQGPPPMRKGVELQETPPPFDENGVRLFIGVVGFPFPVSFAQARGLVLMAGKRLLGLWSATYPSRGVFTLHSSRQFARPVYREIHPGEAVEERYWTVEGAAVGERDVWGYTHDRYGREYERREELRVLCLVGGDVP